MIDKAYEQGKRDGRLDAIETIISSHAERFGDHERRLQIAERILYGMMGVFFIIQFLPEIKKFLGS